MLTSTDGLGNSENYTTDELGEVIAAVNPWGARTDLTRDALSRVTNISLPHPDRTPRPQTLASVAHTWDLGNQLSSHTDEMGRLTSNT